MKILVLLISLFILQVNVLAQIDTSKTKTTQPNVNSKPSNNWYEKIAIRGYTQIRYNRLLETNEDYKNEQGDKSLGKNGGIFLRRVRLIFFGNIHERIYMYIQPDLASSASSTSLHFAQIRDCYFDLAFDTKKEFRVRLGQSKVPFGFENMQSSQNRLPLDRNDALNSAVSNERDLGAFFYWAPQKIRDRFTYLVNSGLKGSGDYGVFALGTFNGQTANKLELNNNLHLIARVTYPFLINQKQIIECSLQAYHGKTTLNKDDISKGVTPVNNDLTYDDNRVAGSLVLYPQPLGIMLEYNEGTGPQYNSITNSIEQKPLKGGYATFSYQIKLKHQIIFPYCRYQFYDGGKKFELDARSYRVRELEAGIEWQPYKNFELVVNYTMGDRTFNDAIKRNNNQKGNLLRIQTQFNF